MELLPKFMIAGVIMAPSAPTGSGVTRESLTRIWTDVTGLHPYQQFILAPSGDGAVLAGGSAPDDGVTIQPPLIQVRENLGLTVDHAADKAQFIFKTVARHVGVNEFFNLGVKLVYHAPAPNKDAKSFVLHRLIGRDDSDFADLQEGGELWAGLKVQTQRVDSSICTLQLEPLLADPSYIYIDADVAFPGPIALDMVKDRVKDVETLVTSKVRAHLERATL